MKTNAAARRVRQVRLSIGFVMLVVMAGLAMSVGAALAKQIAPAPARAAAEVQVPTVDLSVMFHP